MDRTATVEGAVGALSEQPSCTVLVSKSVSTEIPDIYKTRVQEIDVPDDVFYILDEKQVKDGEACQKMKE